MTGKAVNVFLSSLKMSNSYSFRIVPENSKLHGQASEQGASGIKSLNVLSLRRSLKRNIGGIVCYDHSRLSNTTLCDIYVNY